METFDRFHTREGYAENVIYLLRDQGLHKEADEVKRQLTDYENKKYDAMYYLSDKMRVEAIGLWEKLYSYILSVIV